MLKYLKSVVIRIYLPDDVSFIIAHNKKTNEVIEYHANENDTFGVFVFAGYQPNTSLVKDIVELNESGYIVTDQNQKTNKEGIYGAGDVCIKQKGEINELIRKIC